MSMTFIDPNTNPVKRMGVPIATSGDNNVYIGLVVNKELVKRTKFYSATADGGTTFGDKINLSNSNSSESQDVNIGASGDKVYITWWGTQQHYK